MDQWNPGRERVFAVNAGNVNLKTGLFNNVDLLLVVENYVHEQVHSDGVTTRKAGFGDMTAQLKVNLWRNDGGYGRTSSTLSLSATTAAATSESPKRRRISIPSWAFPCDIDKPAGTDDMGDWMHTCLKHVQIFWMITILLIAGGYGLHACESIACYKDCVEQTQSANDESCPAGHSCCDTHSQVALTLPDAPESVFFELSSRSFPNGNEPCIEGPFREIDYPPQLS